MLHNDTLTVARTIADVRRLVAGWHAAGLSVGLVPTMGSLHAGHLALIDRARSENERVLATLFVNPLQFGPNEDFDAYPRDDARDFELLRERRCHAVFAPGIREMFPDASGTLDDAQTRVSVDPLAKQLCGRGRPGHFDGVATIVLKLFSIAQADAAYFGEKDYQQLTIVKRMVRDLCIPVRVVGVPIVREPDGLALSSRNIYLSARERASAPELRRALAEVREKITAGLASDAALAQGRQRLLAAGFERVEYLTLARGDTLEAIANIESGARLFGAAWLGRTRLIDNIAAAPAG